MDAFSTLCVGFYEGWIKNNRYRVIVNPFTIGERTPIYIPIKCVYKLDYLEHRTHTYNFSVFTLIIELGAGEFIVDREFLTNAQREGYTIPRGVLMGYVTKIKRIIIYTEKIPTNIFIDPHILYRANCMIFVCDTEGVSVEGTLNKTSSRSSLISDLEAIEELSESGSEKQQES